MMVSVCNARSGFAALGLLSLLCLAPRAEAAPQLVITEDSLELDLQDGCFFGELVQGSFEVCNEGESAAVGFRPGILFGAGLGVNIDFDPPAATSPQTCFPVSSPNHLACEDREASCLGGVCTRSCSAEGECLEGQICASGRCVNQIEASSCTTFHVEGRIPQVDGFDEPYADEFRRFFFLADGGFDLGELNPHYIGTLPMRCREALPDLRPISMEVEGEWVAGEPTFVTRTLRNEGFIQRPAPGESPPPSVVFGVLYFLASTPDISTHQIPLQGSGLTTLGRMETQTRTDVLVVPPSVVPGEYFLGMIIDSFGHELSKDNNTHVHPTPIRVAAPGLRILTQALPTLILGSHPAISLHAVGGVGNYEWEGWELPPGLSLDGNGTIHGSPAEIGDFTFRVKVESAGMIAERRIAVEVVAPLGPLAVATTRLPAAIQGQPYEGVRLAASGGQPPYRWALADRPGNVLPAGLSGPTEDGLFSGAPVPFAQGRSISVQVQDKRGVVASSELELHVRSSADLRIVSRSFADGVLGVDYDGSCAEAAGGGRPYGWEFERSSLPPGLVAVEEGGALCLQGRPVACGQYAAQIEVIDAGGAREAAELPLSIACEILELQERSFPPLRRGEQVAIQLASIPDSGPSYQLRKGALPEGLHLEADGRIAGVVALDAPVGVRNALVELRDEAGRRGLGALTLRVDDGPSPPRSEKVGSGCASGGSSQLGLLGAVALLAGSGWRRRRSGPAHPADGATQSRSRPPMGGRFLLSLGFASCFGAAALIGCGGDVEIRTLEACEGVRCDAGERCDPEDGICKCGGAGGVICGTGELCSLDGGAQCVSPLCSEARCERGESCEAETGDCSCAGVRCGEDEHCVGMECVPLTRCEDLRCGAGMSCDERDGSCRCAGVACDEGEICVDGSCTVEPCAGVVCGPQAVCNPEDGACHCGGFAGPICQSGEACEHQDDRFVCAASSRCDAVDCKGGTVCDPADGQCRCGGVGSLHPACGSEQSCVHGQCLGGDLCEVGGVPIECRADLSCDPYTGTCRCGGKGGPSCAESERCAWLPEGPRCIPTCTLLAIPSECDEGESCYFDPRSPARAPTCYRAGPLGLGMPCAVSTDCETGLYCGASQTCRKVCDLSLGASVCSDVSSVHACRGFDAPGAEGMGYCVSL